MRLTLTKKQDEAKGTKSFFWEPEKQINYSPGQYFYYTIAELKYQDLRGTTRHFTISSAPTEGTELRLTTRMRDGSGYKRTMDELPIGTAIDGEGPNGTFIMDESDLGPHIMIAGGIGITAYRSMIKNALDKKLGTQLYLIYSNSTPDEIAFKKELDEWAATFPNFKVAFTVSRPEESAEPWTGLTGRIDEPIIQKLIGDWKLEIDKLTWWLCGPPEMVNAMELVLGKLKITTDKVRSEKFTGY